MTAATIGSASRRAGESAEAQFSAACAAYASRGVAWVNKRPTPVRVISKSKAGGKFLAVWADSAGVDYTGCVYGGRAVFAELKSSSEPRLPLVAHGKPRIKPAQINELACVNALGGLALLVVRLELKAGPEWWAVEYPELAEMLTACHERGLASVNPAMLDSYGVRCSLTQPYDIPDWLEGHYEPA